MEQFLQALINGLMLGGYYGARFLCHLGRDGSDQSGTW
jgi:hypothetical protein